MTTPPFYFARRTQYAAGTQTGQGGKTTAPILRPAYVTLHP